MSFCLFSSLRSSTWWWLARRARWPLVAASSSQIQSGQKVMTLRIWGRAPALIHLHARPSTHPPTPWGGYDGPPNPPVMEVRTIRTCWSWQLELWVEDSNAQWSYVFLAQTLRLVLMMIMGGCAVKLWCSALVLIDPNIASNTKTYMKTLLEIYLFSMYIHVYIASSFFANYRKTFSISRTKSQNLTLSRVVLQFSLPNPLKPGVKSSTKM